LTEKLDFERVSLRHLQKTSLAELLYLSDNLACFNYSCADEPLFVMNQIDIIVSVSGSNVIQSFREVRSKLVVGTWTLTGKMLEGRWRAPALHTGC
jgi:hypothetical protein